MALKNYRNYAQHSNTKVVTRMFENDDTTYYIQTVKLPGIQSGTISVNTQFGQMQVLGDVSNYEDLTLTIIIDEDLEVYRALLQYLQKLHEPGTLQNNVPNHQDLNLIMYNNNNKKLLEFRFYNCYLDSISGMDYTFNGDNAELVVTCTIKYNYFKIVE